MSGRTINLFNWGNGSQTGSFTVSSPYAWDLTNLYTTGEIRLLPVPEPAGISLLVIALMGNALGVGRISRTAGKA
jgi:hypothetical protein